MKKYSPDTPIPSSIAGISWPPMNGIYSTALTTICDQLEQSQWWPEQQMQAVQMKQIGKLCQHARNSTTFYAERLKDLKIDDDAGVQLEDFRKIPILTRADIQDHFDDLSSNDPSVERGPIYEQSSSGSTGAPVKVMTSNLINDVNCVLQRRWYDWNGLDGNKPMAYFTSKYAKDGDTQTKGWHLNFPDGDYYINNISVPLTKKVEWLLKIRPAYLVTYPSYASELLHYADKNHVDLSFLEIILVYGENYIEGLRELAERVCGAKVFNKYSSREFSCMALECPQSGLYHIQSDSLFLEVLNEDGSPTAEGSIGKLVGTSLNCTTMPLIRYDIGDNAEVGPKCSCGRGLPTLKRILGRSRQLMRLRGGDRFRPIFNLKYKPAVERIRKLQVIQTSYDDVTIKYVSDEPLSKEHHAGFIKSSAEMFPIPLNVKLVRVDDIPRNAGGKFDDLLCQINE